MSRSPNKLIPDDFTPIPSLQLECDVRAVDQFSSELDAVALLVAAGTDLAERTGLDADALAAAGFDAEPGSSLVIAQQDRPLVLVGLGSDEPTADSLRDAAAAAARASAKRADGSASRCHPSAWTPSLPAR